MNKIKLIKDNRFKDIRQNEKENTKQKENKRTTIFSHEFIRKSSRQFFKDIRRYIAIRIIYTNIIYDKIILISIFSLSNITMFVTVNDDIYSSLLFFLRKNCSEDNIFRLYNFELFRKCYLIETRNVEKMLKYFEIYFTRVIIISVIITILTI